MKKAFCAGVLMAMAGYMAPASAVGPGTLGYLAGTISIGNSFNSGPSGYFSDLYTFDIGPTSYVAATTVTLNFDIPQLPGPEYQLSNMAIEFRDSSNALIGYDNTLDSSNALQLSSVLAVGTGYKFIVSGYVTGTLGGSYGGVLAAAPVPEAKTYAMMLAGLALVGFMARRNARSTV